MTERRRAGRGGTRGLLELARLYGIQTAYYSATKQRVTASPDSLLRILRSLGARVESPSDVPGALRERRAALVAAPLEPVSVVASEGERYIELRRPVAAAGGRVGATVLTEEGQELSLAWAADEMTEVSSQEHEGERYVTTRLPLPPDLPEGYHRAVVELSGRQAETTLIVAPTLAYGDSADNHIPSWGVFLPLYALHTERSWGAGDFSDLLRMVEWVSEAGGDAVGTLPLLPAFLEEPFDPSPYSPVSRLFWNEVYVDPRTAPGLESCREAASILDSDGFRRETERLRGGELVEYRDLMRLKRSVLEPLARWSFDNPDIRREVERFGDDRPEVWDYARFRAACDRHRAGWRSWSEQQTPESLANAGGDDDAVRLYVYAQWLAARQMQELAERHEAGGAALYLDLPIGAHPEGFDVWRHPDVFGVGASAGAPPDIFFPLGQNWGFPSLNPEGVRRDGYRYFRESLRHHMRYAVMLRIDHVMGLHRMFWIPEGAEGRDGVYVRYPAEELYAVLALESQRHQTVLVGEDLGTVPGYVGPAMRRHNVRRMYAAYFQMDPEADPPLATPARNMAASVNTHDMPAFRSFWEGLDIADRHDLGLLSADEVTEEEAQRAQVRNAVAGFLQQLGLLEDGASDTDAVLRALLDFMAASPAQFLNVNLEDLWGEARPQNTPGTSTERPNWRNKALHSFEEFTAMPEVTETLRHISTLRRTRSGGP